MRAFWSSSRYTSCTLFFLVLWAMCRWASGRRPAAALLVAALGWLAYAGWEWLVQIQTPEADIRIDLLVIWPLLAILTFWAIFRVSFSRNRAPQQDE